uniref:Sperm associated antigen 8 n=1 Tax=Echeneis naucrates TaxID=173247 RepID=A0A665XBX2_ECHNA
MIHAVSWPCVWQVRWCVSITQAFLLTLCFISAIVTDSILVGAPDVAALDRDETKAKIQRHGHRGILTMDQESKMESVTTVKAAYGFPQSPGVRLTGMCLCQSRDKERNNFIDKINAELNPPTPKTDFCSTTQRDFSVKGFVPRTTHDYKTEQAITFWSENYQQIQGVTPIQTMNAPFRKSTLFSTPISERLDEIEPPLDS